MSEHTLYFLPVGLQTSLANTDVVDCSHIIGLFNSRVQSSPRQADQARENLRIIGKARNSKKIELVAMDKSMTYEEALELLPGVDATTPFDSGIY